VISCERSMHKKSKGGDICFDVVLNDTVFYPGGGGQPPDNGTIAGLPLITVFRREDGVVVHRVSREVAGRVQVEIDWERRYDHMQQHTAQHLLTAIANSEFGLHTSAFHLGQDRSDIELQGSPVDMGVLGAIEESANQAIRENHPVTAWVVDWAQFEALPVRTRGLPEDHDGPVRLISIGQGFQNVKGGTGASEETDVIKKSEVRGETDVKGETDGAERRIDFNTCGGTHVKSLAELQVIKFVSTENLSRAKRVYFEAGNRVIRSFGEALEREAALNDLLSCGPDDHIRVVKKLQDEQKEVRREHRRIMGRLAQAFGRGLTPTMGVIFHHEPAVNRAGPSFLKAIADVALEKYPDALVFLTAAMEGDGDGGDKVGYFYLTGPEERVASAGRVLLSELSGKGGGGSGVFQGKALRLDRREKALEKLQEGSAEE